MNHDFTSVSPSTNLPPITHPQPPRNHPYSFLPKWVCESASILPPLHIWAAAFSPTLQKPPLIFLRRNLLSYPSSEGGEVQGHFPSFLWPFSNVRLSAKDSERRDRSLWQRRRYRSLAFLEVSTCQRTDADGEVEGDCGARQAVGGGRLGPPSMSVGLADWACLSADRPRLTVAAWGGREKRVTEQLRACCPVPRRTGLARPA